MNTNWKKLQNGSDIRGVALNGVPGEEVNLTKEICETLGISFVKWLSDKKGKNSSDLKISVGTDSRLSGNDLKSGLIIGMTKCGVSVYDCGMASTPAMFMTTVIEGYKYDGAIMITASHLPFNRNGLKFFTMEGGLEKEDISTILNIAEKEQFTISNIEGTIEYVDFISVYSDILVDKIRNDVNYSKNQLRPLEGFKIVVDAGNGSGGFFATKVLQPLGADITGSQFLNPDGNFPNHIPNPENKEAMESIGSAVLNNKADLGIIFDTDVDRAAVVDSKGNEINRNKLIALISSIILEEHPNSTIVTDSITSNGLKKFIEEDLGGKHHRFKRGYKNVINEAIRLNKEGQESHLAIETSGHAAIKENYFLDDGAYLIAKILIKMAKLKHKENKNVDSLIYNLDEPLESFEFRMKIETDDFKTYGNEVIKALKEYAEKQSTWNVVPNNYEGIRVAFGKEHGDGWFLLRLSLHDPIIPLNIESNSKGGSKIIASSLIDFLSSYDKLNTSSISQFLNI